MLTFAMIVVGYAMALINTARFFDTKRVVWLFWAILFVSLTTSIVSIAQQGVV